MSLKSKLWLLLLSSSLTALLLLIGTSAIIGLLFNQGYTHENLNELGHQLTEQAQRSNANPEQIEGLLTAFKTEHPSIEISWLTEDGQLRYATDGRTADYNMNELMNQFLHMPFNLWEKDREISLLFDWSLENKQQFLMMSLPSNAMQGSQIYIYIQNNAQFIQLLLPVALFILTPYVFALFFFLRWNQRLKKLNLAMKEFDASGSILAIKNNSNDEIGQLTRSFNDMSNRIRSYVNQIQELDDKRKSLTADISHDLRTPLTMIIGYAEALDTQIIKKPEEQKKYTANLLKRAKYMDVLLQKLLEIAQLDTYKHRVRLKKQDVGETMRLIVADYIPVLESRAIEMDIQIPEKPIYTSFDEEMMERSIRNLIENAIQHGGEGKYLGIFLMKTNSHIEISIIDHGPGIAEEKQQLIFERFYRGAEGRVGEGLGLGLSIVQEVANAHQGYVRMQSSPHEKTTFTLFLPKNSNNS